MLTAILKAPADLLYTGASANVRERATETHAEVGDRANDGLRVDGRDLRCKVLAEGGNLGCTQRGRIEFAEQGGRINTDAIDNSAGVDTSDHEVNLKILLGMPIADGALTLKQRNDLLASMTDEVGALVLRDNYEQTQVLSWASPRPAADRHHRFIRFLEREGRLNRPLEFLPADDEIAERAAAGRGLTTPERSVLLAYAKIWLKDEVGDSTLPDDPWVARALVEYFPEKLRQTYASYMERHPLRREIITNVIVNQTVNRVGASFAHRLREATATQAADVVRAHLLSREAFAVWAVARARRACRRRCAGAHADRRRSTDDQRSSWFRSERRLREDIATTVPQFARARGDCKPVSQGCPVPAGRAEKRAAALWPKGPETPASRRYDRRQAGALDIVRSRTGSA